MPPTDNGFLKIPRVSALSIESNGGKGGRPPVSRSATPSRRRLSFATHRTPKVLQDIFIGLDLVAVPSTDVQGDCYEDVRFSVAVYDGFGVINTERGEIKSIDLREGGGGVKEVVGRLVTRLREFETSQRYKIQVVALASPAPSCFLTQEPLLLPTIWAKLDAIPFYITVYSSNPPNMAPSASTPLSPVRESIGLPQPPQRKHLDLSFLPPQTARADGEDRAQRVVRAAVRQLAVSVRSATGVECSEEEMEVEVDRAGEVVLVGLGDYEATTSPELWRKFIALCDHFKKNKISAAFFSATPQGGGVALMRHALLRLWHLNGVEVHWYTPEGHPAIFDITKKRFHNVLQGVNPPGIELHDRDKEMFEKWTQANLDTFWSEGAIDSPGRVIVVDDPQLAALIPLIRERYKGVKIAYRSHIQIDTSLVNDASKGHGLHKKVWDYLWNFIKGADVFLAHPVKIFVPKNVLDSGIPVLYMAPSTDPLDGLNKPIGYADLIYYQQFFDRLSQQQCGVVINWARPYITQVARFDPSKGIPTLLAAYLLFRQKLSDLPEPPPLSEIPQLIICGHGSVDDPDGQPIFEEIHDTLLSDAYSHIRSDVSVVRVPPCDRTLGAILQGAWCATQLSTKEGFEVKVTEAIHKRVPIIASSAGGIPLQVRDGVNGWLVEPEDYMAVADHFFDLQQSSVCPLPTVAVLEEDNESPNSYANNFVVDLFAPPPKINPGPPAPDAASSADFGLDSALNGDHENVIGTSEDFWTVGNAVKWMVLWARLSEKPIEKGGKDEEILRELLGDVGGKTGKSIWEGMEGRNVWETIQGKKEDGLVIG